MSAPTQKALDALWAHHHGQWRDPAQVIGLWQAAGEVDPVLLQARASGGWWETLAQSRLTLLVSREYEHLLMAISASNGRPRVSYLTVPHPSGIAVDHQRQIVHIASTRNPNQIIDLEPVTGQLPRQDSGAERPALGTLVPVRSRWLPGCCYLHDLAVVGGQLHANAVGHNAIIRLDDRGGYERVWWPRCIERAEGPIFGRNHLQLNSIAAGPDLSRSFFSASTDRASARRPGHRNFPVDGRGVIFDGATREPLAGGLTRPHSARLHEGRVWVDNSGYGQVGFVVGDRFQPVATLPGWTRGLFFADGVAFVGTSRVIPRFRHYAPGLDVDASRCGLHAIDWRTGRVLGSLIWPAGNQIFAIEAMPADRIAGLPFVVGRARQQSRERALFYAYSVARG